MDQHPADGMTGSKAGADSGRRALQILFAFTEQRPVVSVRQISEDLAIPAPSVHRYVAMLRDMGLIEERGRGQYCLTMRVTALGRAARLATPMVTLAEPYMRELVNATGETAAIFRMVQGRPVCIHRVESSQRIRLTFDVGQLAPPLRGSSPRILLGNRTAAEREEYVDEALASGALAPANGRDQYLRDVERDVGRGWAVSNEEVTEGVWAVSSPITDGTETVAALTALCAEFRLDAEKKETIIALVRETAARISGHTAS